MSTAVLTRTEAPETQSTEVRESQVELTPAASVDNELPWPVATYGPALVDRITAIPAFRIAMGLAVVALMIVFVGAAAANASLGGALLALVATPAVAMAGKVVAGSFE